MCRIHNSQHAPFESVAAQIQGLANPRKRSETHETSQRTMHISTDPPQECGLWKAQTAKSQGGRSRGLAQVGLAGFPGRDAPVLVWAAARMHRRDGRPSRRVAPHAEPLRALRRAVRAALPRAIDYDAAYVQVCRDCCIRHIRQVCTHALTRITQTHYNCV